MKLTVFCLTAVLTLGAQAAGSQSMNEHLPTTDAEKITDANVDGHPHAVQRTAQDHALAMKFDLPHAAIRAGIVRIETDGQGKRVEPQGAARPSGMDPAC